MTNNDPFANPAGTPATPPTPPPTSQPAPPPGLLTPQGAPPGMLTPPSAPYGAPVPPPGTFGAPTGYRPAAPSGLALWAIILTGLYALVGLYGALTAASAVDKLKDQLENPSDVTIDPASTFSGLLSFVIGIGSFVVLALWMTKIRANRTQVGTTPGGPPAVEWWGWFIPFANFILPFLGMRAITKRIVGVGILLAWWLPFCVSWIAQGVASTAQFQAVDLATGELKDPAALDTMVPLAWVGAVAILLSWAALAAIIRKTTAEHLDA